MITAKELQQRRLACVGDIITKIEAEIIRADDQFRNTVDYTVLKLSPAVIDELIHRIRSAGYTVTRQSGSGRVRFDDYDFLRIEWQ
jgi:hypothetical protein